MGVVMIYFCSKRFRFAPSFNNIHKLPNIFVLTYTQQNIVWRKNWWFYKVHFSTLMVDFTDSRTFVWPFSWTFGLSYSPLKSATPNCSSEITLMSLVAYQFPLDMSNFEYLMLFSSGRSTWRNQNKYSIP